MRHGLGRGKRPVGFGQARLRGNRLFRRSRVRIWLDRLPRLVLQRYKDQWEQEFCLVQGVTSFLWDGADLLKMKVTSLAGINPLQMISQPILHPCSRLIDKSRQLQ